MDITDLKKAAEDMTSQWQIHADVAEMLRESFGVTNHHDMSSTSPLCSI